MQIILNGELRRAYYSSAPMFGLAFSETISLTPYTLYLGLLTGFRIFLTGGNGYRSMIGASILKARGWENIIDVEGGFKAISEHS